MLVLQPAPRKKENIMVTKQNGSRSVDTNKVQQDVMELSVKRAGNTISVPEGVDLGVAIEALARKRDEEEEFIDLTFDYNLTIPEGCVALFRSLQDLFSFVSVIETPGFFGASPPSFINIEVSETEEVSVPWGRFVVPGVTGFLTTTFNVRDGIPYFQLAAHVPGKHRHIIEKVNDSIKGRTDSIYRGNVISLKYLDPGERINIADAIPKFVRVAPHTKSDLILSDAVGMTVEMCLFVPIEHSRVCRDNGVPLKRGILLEGPYGVGKTLTAAVTANLAKKNGWTFIHVDSAYGLKQAYEFAKHHQPAVVFCEDVDEALAGERDEDVNEVLNSIDGIDSKELEVILVMTTNDVESITKAILRPGRIDTVVPVRAPDAKAAERLMRKYAGNLLEADSDLTEAAAILAGKNAAMIREVVERSKLYSISRGAGAEVWDGKISINGSDLAVAGRGMEAHYKLLEEHQPDRRSDQERAASIMVEGNKEILDKVGAVVNGVLGLLTNDHGELVLPPKAAKNGHSSVSSTPAE